jgi:hypothetical protein
MKFWKDGEYQGMEKLVEKEMEMYEYIGMKFNNVFKKSYSETDFKPIKLRCDVGRICDKGIQTDLLPRIKETRDNFTQSAISLAEDRWNTMFMNQENVEAVLQTGIYRESMVKMESVTEIPDAGRVGTVKKKIGPTISISELDKPPELQIKNWLTNHVDLRISQAALDADKIRRLGEERAAHYKAHPE